MSSNAIRRLHALAPFAGAAYFPIVLTPFPGAEWNLALLLIAGGLTTVLLLLGIFVPWDRLPASASAAPALSYLLVIVLLREAGGGNSSGIGPMVLLPVIWLALYGTRGSLALAIVGAALVYWLPIVLDATGQRYPVSGWRVGAVFIPMLAVVGLTVERLHRQVKGQARRLAGLAHTDELTGLPNRRAWDIALDAVLRASLRGGPPVCVALIDVDSFKVVNDRDGHNAGDRLLVAMTGAWLHQLRRGDTLARLGGDEFAVLMPGCNAADAHHFLERARSSTLGASASIGLAQWDGAQSGTELLRRADEALYQAKREGRDRLVSAPSLPIAGSA